MSRAVANTLLPAARPASTIARPRPRELPVTNHICAIHPPLSSNPPDILEKLLKLRIGCAMGIRKDLLVTEEIRRNLQTSPLCYCEAPKRIGLTMVSILAAISSAGMRLGVWNQRRAAPKTAQAAVVAGSDASASGAIP